MYKRCNFVAVENFRVKFYTDVTFERNVEDERFLHFSPWYYIFAFLNCCQGILKVMKFLDN